MMKSRWQKKQTQPAHADDWLMTYADMITLLLCFFVVLLIVSIAKKDPAHATVTQTVHADVKTEAPVPEPQPAEPLPQVFRSNLPFRQIEPADFKAIDHPATDAVDVMPGKVNLEPEVPTPDAIIPAPDVITAPVSQEVVKTETPPPALLPATKPDAVPAIMQKGDRITTLDMASAAFFDSGSATLSEVGKGILQGVAVNLKSEEYKDYQITVEGHTDDTPIKTPQFPSNWELSTARASAVVHYFLEQGIAPQKLRAAGYADTFPKFPNRDEHGNPIPSNQAQNRRVVIKLEKIDRQQD